LAKVRQKSRKTNNVHTEFYIDGTYKEVRRNSLTSFFKEDQDSSLYVSYKDCHKGMLLGCAVTKNRVWWVKLTQDNGQLDSDICYKIWDALHNWLERLGTCLDKKFPKLSIGPVLFFLDITGLSSYTPMAKNPSLPSDRLINISVDKITKTIFLHLKKPFLYYFRPHYIKK
jgi:hypothetical protein